MRVKYLGLVSKTFAKVVLTVDWGLTAELFEHLCSTGESVARFADGDVEDEFLDAELAHGICALVLLGFRLRITMLAVHLDGVITFEARANAYHS